MSGGLQWPKVTFTIRLQTNLQQTIRLSWFVMELRSFWHIWDVETRRLKIMEVGDLNSQVSSWFLRTNDPLIWPCPVLNMVVSQRCFKGLPLKFYFRYFGDICSNRKGNFKRAINRKWQPEILLFIWHRRFEGMSNDQTFQNSLVTWYYLAINTLGCK